jgi:hypothetical protein
MILARSSWVPPLVLLIHLFVASASTAQVGTWTSLQVPTRRAWACAVYDSAADRAYVFGGLTDFGNHPWDMWVLGRTGGWLSFFSDQVSAYGRSAIFDPVRRRIVLCEGGLSGVFTRPLDGRYFEQPLAVAGAAPVRRGNTVIYDPLRDRMIIFGGTDGADHNDVWALTLSGTPTWSQLAPTGALPPVREAATAVYDPVRDRMIVYGGRNTAPLGDVWALDLSGSTGWTQLSAGGQLPPSRADHVAIYDPNGDRMIVSGGASSVFLGDSWSLSLSGALAWSRITSAAAPPARRGAVAIYDPVAHRMLLLGGESASGYLADAWALSLAGPPAWTSMGPAGMAPMARANYSAVYDPARRRMLFFGGNGADTDPTGIDVLQLPGLGAWSSLTTNGPTPTARSGQSVILDPNGDQLVVFGGCGSMGCPSGEAWLLKLTGTPTWSQLPTPPSVPPRSSHCAVFDPRRDRMLVFGGTTKSGGGPSDTDVWALSLDGTPTWSKVATTGATPAPRTSFAMVLDPVRDRLIVYGGQTSYSDPGIWALSLAGTPTWSEIQSVESVNAPPPQTSPSMIYDPIRDRVFVWGGSEGSQDAWALDLGDVATWQHFTPQDGFAPTPRSGICPVYDPSTDRMMMFSGSDYWKLSPPQQGDLWSLSWNNPVRPVANCPQQVRWTWGSSRDISIVVANPFPGDRAFGWSLTGGPASWATLPQSGIELVHGLAADTLHVTVQVPDSIAIAGFTLTWSIAWAGAAGNYTQCFTDVFLDSPTPTLVSLYREDVSGSRVTLEWKTVQAGMVTLERTSAGSAWTSCSQLFPDGEGTITWVDTDVRSGQNYGYRLRLSNGELAGPWWVEVPRELRFSLDGTVPNPSSGPFEIRYTLPDAGEVKLEVVDVAGRLVLRQRFFGEVGIHTAILEGGRQIEPGIYLVRLTHSGRTLEAHAAVIR